MLARAGKFITFEGGEGAGKSTQIRHLQTRLVTSGVSVVTTREPGGTPAAEAIRAVLLEDASDALPPLSEALLQYAARLDHVQSLIKPALSAGKWVLCDRFFDSTTAYQGAGQGVPVAELTQLRQLVLGEFKPDLTLVLDLPPAEGLARAMARGDGNRFEAKGKAFHETLRTAFRDIAEAAPGRCALIDASQEEDAVANAIWQVVCDRLKVTA